MAKDGCGGGYMVNVHLDRSKKDNLSNDEVINGVYGLSGVEDAGEGKDEQGHDILSVELWRCLYEPRRRAPRARFGRVASFHSRKARKQDTRRAQSRRRRVRAGDAEARPRVVRVGGVDAVGGGEDDSKSARRRALSYGDDPQSARRVVGPRPSQTRQGRRDGRRERRARSAVRVRRARGLGEIRRYATTQDA